ncbi:MAG TPA: hypothetical protein VHG93_20205 [Longimicrobium sp.]|nr:hypothetical protein [Longimicrobium sp.]
MTANSTTVSGDEIRRAGLDVLLRELGVVGMVRFIQQFDPGSGDYTAERARLHANTTTEGVMAAIQKVHAESKRAPNPPRRQPPTRTFSPDTPEEEIRQAGLDVLRRALGPRGIALFLQQFIKPAGNYTAERHTLLGNPSVAEIVASIERRKAEAARTAESGE